MRNLERYRFCVERAEMAYAMARLEVCVRQYEWAKLYQEVAASYALEARYCAGLEE